jgi:hypothetical protein
VERLHILTRRFGWFCDECCPCCRPQTDGEVTTQAGTPVTKEPSLAALPTVVVTACILIDQDGVFAEPLRRLN